MSTMPADNPIPTMIGKIGRITRIIIRPATNDLQISRRRFPVIRPLDRNPRRPVLMRIDSIQDDMPRAIHKHSCFLKTTNIYMLHPDMLATINLQSILHITRLPACPNQPDATNDHPPGLIQNYPRRVPPIDRRLTAPIRTDPYRMRRNPRRMDPHSPNKHLPTPKEHRIPRLKQ